MVRTPLSAALAAALARRLPPQGTQTVLAAHRTAEESSPWRTRFAPAPTGFLHLGHVVNALYVWGIARAYGGQVLLRVEDHDRTRCRPEFEAALLEDLDWMGFLPDVGPTQEFRAGPHPLRQSDNAARYTTLLERLGAHGLTYGCTCTRREVRRVVPAGDNAELRYPGTCAGLNQSAMDVVAQRFRTSSDAEAFDDVWLGLQVHTPQEQCGDFLVRDRNGNFTYQYSVTVDDLQQDIGLVIRGADLLDSTARQLQLARALGRPHPPLFLHHGLLMRADGIKLSKSLGDTGVREMRARGLAPEAVLGEAAYASGLAATSAGLAQDELGLLFT